MEVLVAILVAFGVWLLGVAGRLTYLARRHWAATVGLAVASLVVCVVVTLAPWAPAPVSADYSHGDATVRALIANP